MSSPRALHRMSGAPRLLVILLLATGTIALAGGWLPTTALETFGEWVGHADDLSPVRITRLRVAGTGCAAAHFLIAALLATTWRAGADEFLSRLGGELQHWSPVMGLGRAWVWANRPGMFHLVAVVIVVILAAAIRFRYVHAPMDYDEAYSYLNYARRPLYQGLADYNSTNNHLLNTLAMHLADFGFGPREWALRLHVLLAGIGVVATSYVLGRSLLGAETGLLMAAVLSTTFVAINYSVNARGYVWVTWMTELLMLAFWRLGARGEEPLAYDWLAAGWAAIVGLFAVPTMIYPVIGGCAWLTWQLWRDGADGRRGVVGLGVWLLLVGLVVAWLYTPAFIVQGFSAWRHPFVSPLLIHEWIGRIPVCLYVAARSWAEGQLPWLISAVLAVIGLANLWLVRRAALGLTMAVLGGTLVVMFLQRVAPPPRILSFLAPLFAFVVAAGVDGLGRVIFLPFYPTEVETKTRQFGTLCNWMACGLVIWGHFDSKHRLLPGGPRPAFLVENIPSVWAEPRGPVASPPQSQHWRLDLNDALDIVVAEMAAADRVLVGLPADLPFHFYAERRGWPGPINGTPLPGERLLLVLRNVERPHSGLQENPSLQITDPAVLDRQWELLADGNLRVWRSVPSNAP